MEGFFNVLCSLFRCVQPFATPWTVGRQTPLSMGFSRQEYWSGLLFPSTGDLPDPRIEPGSPALQADSLLFEPPERPHLWKEHAKWKRMVNWSFKSHKIVIVILRLSPCIIHAIFNN